MPGRKNYYELLGVSSSATPAEIKRGYREQALLHHPDKNPDRVEEATEQFKLVAEAYSVLQDAQQRAKYDAGGIGMPDFNLDRARDLFRDVFGGEFADKLTQAAGVVGPHVAAAAASAAAVAEVAAPHVRAAASTAVAATASGLSKAAESVGKTSMVREAMASHLTSLTEEASSKVAQKMQAEELCRITWEDHMKLLEEHAAKAAAVYKTRRSKQVGWWGSIEEWATGEQKAKDEKWDRDTAAMTLRLQKQVEESEAAWKQCQKELVEAEAQASCAQRDEEEVQRDGASLGQALKVGAQWLKCLDKSTAAMIRGIGSKDAGDKPASLS